jgi:hypothetical protein
LRPESLARQQGADDDGKLTLQAAIIFTRPLQINKLQKQKLSSRQIGLFIGTDDRTVNPSDLHIVIST